MTNPPLERGQPAWAQAGAPARAGLPSRSPEVTVRTGDERIPMRRIGLALWALGILTFPIYLFPSGRPQISTAFFGGFILITLNVILWQQPLLRDPAQRTAALFGLWCLLVGVGWTIGSDSLQPLQFGIILAFNGALCLSVIEWMRREQRAFLRTTVMALAVVVLWQAATVLLNLGDQTRFEGTFNNPNQLGYFGLLAIGILIAAGPAMHALPRGVAIAASVLLSFGSLSRGAMAAVIAYLIPGLIRRGRFAIAIGVAVLALTIVSYPQILDDIQWRWDDRRLEEGYFANRGYDRIVENPQYLLTGAAEGAARHRGFVSSYGGELHSTGGTLLFAYGLIGAGLFLRLLWQSAGRLGLWGWALIGPAMLYGLTHAGHRFVPFWILIGIMAGLGARGEPPEWTRELPGSTRERVA